MPALFAVVLLLTHLNAELCPKSETVSIGVLHHSTRRRPDARIASWRGSGPPRMVATAVKRREGRVTLALGAELSGDHSLRSSTRPNVG